MIDDKRRWFSIILCLRLLNKRPEAIRAADSTILFSCDVRECIVLVKFVWLLVMLEAVVYEMSKGGT